MADDKITTIIKCQNMAPIENLTREIKSSSLKMGVFANNRSGKIFLSRLFRPTEKQDELVLDENGKSPADVGKLAHSIALYGAAKTNVSSRRNYNDLKYAR